MKLTHEYLARQGAKWLKAHGYPIVKIESHSNRLEHPDVIGFNASHSAVIEVKISKEDFLRDFNKHCRQPWFTGLGNYRFFLVPESLFVKLKVEPESKWHYLLARDDGSIYSTEIHPKSNQIPWNRGEFGSDMAMERSILYTLVRNSRGCDNCPYYSDDGNMKLCDSPIAWNLEGIEKWLKKEEFDD